MISVSVNGEEYRMTYLESIGFMVLIRPASGEIKFFQGIGYGFRREEAGRILRGAGYRGKNCPNQKEADISLVGLPLQNIAFGDEFLQRVKEVMDSPDGTKVEGSFEIYRRLVLCRMIRIKLNCESDGVLIFIEDKSNIEDRLSTGRAYIAELEADIMPVDGLIAFAESEGGAQVFGPEKSREVADHGKKIKAAGAKYCDCPACAAAEAILTEKDHMLA